MEIVKIISRELTKMVICVALWGFPFWFAYQTRSSGFLWLLVLSLFCMTGVFSHYEDLARIENNKDNGEEKKED